MRIADWTGALGEYPREFTFLLDMRVNEMIQISDMKYFQITHTHTNSSGKTMTVISVSSYYPSFKISPLFEIPSYLRNLLQELLQKHYEELYEKEADGTTSIENAFEKILDTLWSRSDKTGHHRYVWMAYALALAAKPTLEAYLPNDSRSEQVIERTATWLKDAAASSVPQMNNLFPQMSVGSQAIDEAIDVFRNLLRVTVPTLAREALLEILDDCFEGYAIFPGSAGKRDLFNWWLVEVVPAAWCLRLPNFIYTVNNPQCLVVGLIS